MQRRSHLQPITLSTEEYRQLLNWSRGRRVGRSLAMRARIILQCGRGRSNREVARRVGLTEQTVCKWRQRFVAERVHGLRDLAKTLHEPPPDAERWSSRRLASELGISQRAVLRIWRAFEL